MDIKCHYELWPLHAEKSTRRYSHVAHNAKNVIMYFVDCLILTRVAHNAKNVIMYFVDCLILTRVAHNAKTVIMWFVYCLILTRVANNTQIVIVVDCLVPTQEHNALHFCMFILPLRIWLCWDNTEYWNEYEIISFNWVESSKKQLGTI